MAATQLPAVHYLEDPDVPRAIGVVGDSAVGDVQPRLVRGKAQPVGPDQIVSYHRNFTGYSIQPVDPRGKFGLGSLSLVRHQNSIARIGKPDSSVGMNYHIIWSVEGFAVEAVQQHGEAPVVLGAGNPSCQMLAGNQTPLAVSGVAVAVVGGLTEHCDLVGYLAVSQHPVVGYIAEDQGPEVAEPHWALGPARSGIQSLNGGIADSVGSEAWVQDLHRRVRVSNYSLVPASAQFRSPL
jgi:hypothetical protein